MVLKESLNFKKGDYVQGIYGCDIIFEGKIIKLLKYSIRINHNKWNDLEIDGTKDLKHLYIKNILDK